MAYFQVERRQEMAAFMWVLYSKDDKALLQSSLSFDSVGEAKENIKMIKKACGTYTQVRELPYDSREDTEAKLV